MAIESLFLKHILSGPYLIFKLWYSTHNTEFIISLCLSIQLTSAYYIGNILHKSFQNTFNLQYLNFIFITTICSTLSPQFLAATTLCCLKTLIIHSIFFEWNCVGFVCLLWSYYTEHNIHKFQDHSYVYLKSPLFESFSLIALLVNMWNFLSLIWLGLLLWTWSYKHHLNRCFGVIYSEMFYWIIW